MWRLTPRKCEIVKDSVILLEQLRTIDKTRLRDRVCHLDESVLRRGGPRPYGKSGTAYINRILDEWAGR